jgi:ubiquinone/menaquinone biosynthesis C-methylase UbiE
VTAPGTNASDAIHDQLAADYTYEIDHDTASRLKHDVVRHHLGERDRLLDVGCANGLHLRLFAPRCAEAVGVDTNKRMLELASAKLASDGIENARVVEASATALPFDDGTFDIAYSFSTLLLVPEPSVALDEIARVVRPGGITVLDFTGRFNLSQRHWRRWYQSQGHFGLNAFSLRDVLRSHRKRGLEPFEVHGVGLTDQWKYARVLRRLTFLQDVFHSDRTDSDLDYRLSSVSVFRALANRWYVVARKT